MTVSDVSNMLSRFQELGGQYDSVACTDPDAVVSLQADLGVQFPDAFVRFYQKFHYLAIRSDEFHALGTLTDIFCAETKSLRKRCFFPVLEDGMGGYYYLVCTRAGKTRGSDFGCVLYHPGCEPGIEEFAASDFLAFVASRIELWMRLNR